MENIYQIAYRALFEDAADCMVYMAEQLHRNPRHYPAHLRSIVIKLLAWEELAPTEITAWYRWAIHDREHEGEVIVTSGADALALANWTEIPLYTHELGDEPGRVLTRAEAAAFDSSMIWTAFVREGVLDDQDPGSFPSLGEIAMSQKVETKKERFVHLMPVLHVESCLSGQNRSSSTQHASIVDGRAGNPKKETR